MKKSYCETGNSHLMPHTLLLLTVYDTAASGRKETRVIYWKRPMFWLSRHKDVKTFVFSR